MTNSYNGRGLAYAISGTDAGDLVTSTYYNQLGQLTEINLGNTLKTTFGYYGLGGTYDTTGGYYGKLWELTTLPQAGGVAIQDVRYTWDATGNLLKRINCAAAETEYFIYDSIDRLVIIAGAYEQVYTYDTIGNITSMDGEAYTYSTKPHIIELFKPEMYHNDTPVLMLIENGKRKILPSLSKRIKLIKPWIHLCCMPGKGNTRNY